MDNKNPKFNKANSSNLTLNPKNIIINQTTNKNIEELSLSTNNQLKINNSNKSNNKINVVKLIQKEQKKNSLKTKNKNEKQSYDKNALINTKLINNTKNSFINNENNKKLLKNKYLQTKTYNTKINSNKFIRTFSGCGNKRKCSLNNKGTFTTDESRGRKIVIRNNSKEKEKYYAGNSLLSNDIDVIQEFNSTNVNNFSYKKSNKFNTIITMTNYQQKDKEKFIKKINKEELKLDKKKNFKKDKQKIIKPRHNIKYKEEISINDNKDEIQSNKIKEKEIDKDNFISKNTYEKKFSNKNNINSTIDESINTDKKIIKIHIIDSFKQKSPINNLIYINNKDIQKEGNKKNNTNSVDNKINQKQIINNANKSNEIMNNYFSYNQMSDIVNNNTNKKLSKINNCLKKSVKNYINIKKYDTLKKNNSNNIEKINNNNSKNKNDKNINAQEIKTNKYNNDNKSIKKGTLNLRTVSSNENLKNSSYNKYIKINKYNKYFSHNYSNMSNRIKLALNVVNNKNNYNNIKHSLIRNIKNQLVEENNFNNLLFILNIISNWGNKKQIGMTGIEIFDINNQKIKIKECIVEGGTNKHIERLYNDKIYTINENDMWTTDIISNNNQNSLNIKLYFYISNYINLESINNINIWNYNSWELSKGIKKIEILTKDEDIIYYGIVPKGENNVKCFHPYKIRINKKILLKRNKNKIYKNTHLLYNTYKYDVDPSFDLNYVSCNNSILSKSNKSKNEISNLYFTLMKQSSLNNQRKINRLNFVKVKSSRSCHKDIHNKCSFINYDFKRYRNYSESKNKRYIVNKIKSIKKLKNNSFIFPKNQKKIWKNEKLRGISEIHNYKKEKNKEYCSSTTNLEKKNILNNIKSFDSFNKHNFNNLKTINYNRYNNIITKKTISNFSTTNNTNNTNTNTISFNSKSNKYITFKKLRINILTNYGNFYVVGLTGLNLIDKNNKIIDINLAMAVGALPKDLKTIYYNQNENRIFENLFNGLNNTINENLMWLTLLNPNPFIEICFNDEMNLSRIEIWNYNEPLGLDKGAKDIEIIFDDNENKKYNIMLWKGLGIDYYNYYQKINFTQLENYSNIDYLKINNFNINKNKLPTGFVFKLIFISNFGDKEMISLKKFELYNEKNNLLSNYTIIHDNYNENYLNNNSNKDILKNNMECIKNYFYYHKLFDFRKDEDSICNNLLFICFNDIVQIKYIKIENISNGRLKFSSTKYIQIYCDDMLIFEGELKQKGENIILFEEKEIKKFNNVININKNKDKNKFVEKIKGDVYRLINVNSIN